MVTVELTDDDLVRLAWGVELALGHEQALALERGGRHVGEAREYHALAARLARLRRTGQDDA